MLRVLNIVGNDNQAAIDFALALGYRQSSERGRVTVQMTIDLDPL